MRSFNLLLTTKTKDSLKKFLNFFNTSINTNFNFIKKSISKKQKKIVITILKSPHVNKTAQEQFEMRFISKQLRISTTQIYKFIIFLKKVKNFLFADINFKIKFIANNNCDSLANKKIFSIDNFKNNFYFENNTFIKNKTKKLKQTKKTYNKLILNNCINSKNIFKLLDLYGN
jgi:ribosomal protein S10